MQNVARGAGLSGLAALILACAMAAPAVAGGGVNPTITPTIVHPNMGPYRSPTGGGIKTVRPPQNSKSNLGRPPSVKAYRLNSQKGGGTTTGGGGTVDVTVSDTHSPKQLDPLLGLNFANRTGPHRNQLDYKGVYQSGGSMGTTVNGVSRDGVSTVEVSNGSTGNVVFYMSGGHGFFNYGTGTAFW